MKHSNTIATMALVLGLAGVLGAVFNNAHPLGVRFETAPTPMAPSVAKPNPATNSITSTQAVSITVSNPAPATPPVVHVHTHSTPASNPAPVGPAVVLPAPPPQLPPPPPPINHVTWAQAKEQLVDGKTVLVDARVATYYQAGHIPDAVSLPAHSPEALAEFKTKYSTTTPLIIYCGAEACNLSQSLAITLTTQHGYSNVKVMPGGFNEWVRARAEEQSKETQPK